MIVSASSAANAGAETKATPVSQQPSNEQPQTVTAAEFPRERCRNGPDKLPACYMIAYYLQGMFVKSGILPPDTETGLASQPGVVDIPTSADLVSRTIRPYRCM